MVPTRRQETPLAAFRNVLLRWRYQRASIVLFAVILIFGNTACTDGRSDSSEKRGDGNNSRNYEATIQRTTGGVAHITASDLGNLAFGQGYASGEDHTCSLAEEIIKVNSSRSRWFGPGENDENITSDFGWLALGIRKRAETDYPSQNAEVHEMMAGFVAGWNQHLKDTGIDAINGWCRGQPWVTPISELDLYTYSRSVMLLASGARLIDYMANAQPPSAEPTESGTSVSFDNPSSSIQATFATSTNNPVASNGWAIGADRSESTGGLLLANPHFPWEGPLRFWEVGLEIPGQLHVYGAQLIGLPGVGIGFNDAVAWTHTVSAGNRFTAYTLDLVEGDPTSYKYDDGQRKIESSEASIDVLNPDGTTHSEKRTLWHSHYGPIINFPGVGWTEQQTVTYRDANIDNTAFLDQYLGMNRAKNLDEFIDAHATQTGIPLFNTIATSADGRAWYADTSATPNLSNAALDAYEHALESDLLVSLAAKQGAVLLDGSSSQNEWIDEPGARSPGLVPFSRMPQTTRSDYLFNANDSFWLSHADEMLAGDYSPLHGRQAVPVSPRTHENARLLRDVSPSGPSGPDGRFSLDELTDAAFFNTGWTAHQLRTEVVTRCSNTDTVHVPESSDRGSSALPAGDVSIGEACQILEQWDGRYEVESVGAGIWREFLAQFKPADLRDAGPLFNEPFDPANPVDTPSGLAAQTTAVGSEDSVLIALARSVQIFNIAGFPLDSPLGDLQVADRNGTRIGVHGGDSVDGVTNVVTWAGPVFPTEEDIPSREAPIAPWSSLTKQGYLIDAGTSFVLAVQYGDNGPVARSILTYGESGDQTSPQFTEATQQFAAKQWKTVLFTSDQIASDPNLSTTTVRG